MTFKRFAAVVTVIIAAAFTAQARYADILKIRRANSGIAALRSMSDGEHYTTLQGKSIVRTAYADRNDCTTLFTAPFAVALGHSLGYNGTKLTSGRNPNDCQ